LSVLMMAGHHPLLVVDAGRARRIARRAVPPIEPAK